MTQKKEQPLLTEQQAWDVKQFAVALNTAMYEYPGIYTPNLANRNLLNLTGNPDTPDYDKIIKVMTEGLSQSERLNAYQTWMEFADMIFKRTMEYYSNILSFDLTITAKPKAQNKDADYNSSAYKKDLKIVHDFLDNFDYQAEFKRVVRQMLRSETAYMWLRNNGNIKNPQYTLQLMPQDRCLLTGYWQHNIPLYDFDMNYFLQAGVDIDEYDDFFKEQFNKMFERAGALNYKPTADFLNRDGTFAYTTQTTPLITKEGMVSGAWVFKLDNSNFHTTPFLGAMMKDTILNIPIQKLQYDKDAAAAHAYIVGEIGMLQKMEQNATKFDPTRLGALLNVVKSAVGKNVSVGAMPAENLKWFQYSDDNITMYNEQLKTSAGVGSAASRVVYATDKMSQEEIRNAIITDANIMSKVYPQFGYFLEFYINQLTTKYHFYFTFQGTTYPFEQQKRQDSLMKLAEDGIILNESAFASAFGYKPTDFHRMMEETATSEGWLKNLRQLQSLHTQSGKGGRPVQEDVNTQSREYDSSEE